MDKQTWVALDKGLAVTFKDIRRKYSEIEAMFSYSLDVNCGKERSLRDYSRMWSWDRGTVKRFVEKIKAPPMHHQRTTKAPPYKLILLGIDNREHHKSTTNAPPTHHKYKEQEQEQEEKTIVEQEPRQRIPHAEIIAFLNQEAETNFKHTTKATIGFIKARWREGFRLDDFKAVITHKCEEWKGDEKMGSFLRPATLFGTKFESYLQNAGPGTNTKKKEWVNVKKSAVIQDIRNARVDYRN